MGIERFSDKLKKLTIKLESKNKKTNNLNLGSGFLYKHPISEEIYLFTAKHCIFDVNENNAFNKKDKFSNYEVVIKYKFDDKDDFIELKILKSYKSKEENDFLVFLLDKASLNKNHINTLPNYEVVQNLDKSLNNEKINYTFRGYPKVLDSLAQLCNCFYLEDAKLQSEHPLIDSSGENAKEIVSGFSGSGIFFEKENSLFLGGIIIEIMNKAGSFNTYKYLPLNFLNDFFRENKIPIINIINFDEINKYLLRKRELDYLNSIIKNNDEIFENLFVKETILPANFFDSTNESPIIRDVIDEDVNSKVYSLMNDFNYFSERNSFLITGKGGSGKTTSLKMIRTSVSEKRIKDPSFRLPIYIELKNYSSNLENLINEVIDISKYDKNEPFLLLCDGFNEVEDIKQKQLLNELQKIYKNKNVSIIITLRKSGLKKACSFESKITALELIPLNQYQMVNLSKKKIENGYFSKFYDDLFFKLNTRNNSIYYLPFGLEMCIQIFNMKKEIPSSQSSILEEYIKNRINRISISKDYKIDKENILKFSYLLAFNIRVKLRKNIIPKSELKIEIGKCLEKFNSENIYDQIKLENIEIIDILTDYEIILPINNDNYTFEHDLIADYLTSREFSKNWKNYLSLLKSELFDDIWIFTSSLIKKEEINDFILEIEKEDIILASFCAVEYGNKAIKIIERIILSKIDIKDRYSRWKYENAMIILGTKKCIDFLINIIKVPEQIYGEYFQEKMALIKIGYEPLIIEILDEAEKYYNLPMKITCNEINLCNSTPINIKLKLVRKRLKEKDFNGNIKLSVETLSLFGFEEDGILLKKVFDKNTNIDNKLHTFYWWYILKPEKALESINKLIKDLDNSLNRLSAKLLCNIILLKRNNNIIDYIFLELLIRKTSLFISKLIRKKLMINSKIIRLLLQINEYNNVNSSIFSFLELKIDLNKIADTSDYVNVNDSNSLYLETSQDDFFFFEQEKLFENLKNSNALIDENLLLDFYKSSENLIAKNRFLQLATKHKFKSFDDFVLNEINSNNWEHLSIGDFIKSKIKEKEFADKITLLIKENQDKFFSNGYISLLDYLIEKNENKLSSKIIIEKLNQIIANKNYLDFEWDLQRILPLAYKVVKYIGKSTILSIITINTNNSIAKEYFPLFLRELTNKEIDKKLKELKESSDLEKFYSIYNFLELASNIESTEYRRELIKDLLPQVINFPLYLTKITNVIKNLWSEDVFKNIVDAFYNVEWDTKYFRDEGLNKINSIIENDFGDDYHRFTQEIEIFISNNITKKMAIKYLKPLLNKNLNTNTKEIFELWYKFGVNKR